MDKNILEEIIAASSFSVEAFDGAIKIEGRILSPNEVEAAGLASALLASAIFKGQSKEQIAKTQEVAERVEKGDVENIEDLLQMVESISPDQLERMAEREDLLLIRCVRRVSKDSGETWERLHLVSGIDQQNAKQNKLWVGMLRTEDRKAILDRAMSGHKEAAARLAGFRAG